MAKRVILVSDVSGKEIPDEEQVEVQVLSYPGLNMPVKLDASKTEADRLKIDARPMALLRLIGSDGSEEIAVDAELFAKAIHGDADEVLAMAEGLQLAPQPEAPRRRGRRSSGQSAPAGER